MKTLYLSDLDGTLLGKNAQLSEYTISTLNELIHQGIHFSVATARTAATAVFMLERVALNIPIILMNGVLIYDLNTKKYLKKELLEQEKVAQIVDAMKKVKITGFMYALADNQLITYYERIQNEAMQRFMEERVQKYHKKFNQVDNLGTVKTDIIYFCLMDLYENIKKLYDEIKTIKGLQIELYQDIYSTKELWYLEVFSDTASKYHAASFLREQYQFDKVIGFGDNLNDLPLFSACDACYAVANAKDEVKEKASAVIGANDGNGVARWLEEHAIRGE